MPYFREDHSSGGRPVDDFCRSPDRDSDLLAHLAASPGRQVGGRSDSAAALLDAKAVSRSLRWSLAHRTGLPLDSDGRASLRRRAQQLCRASLSSDAEALRTVVGELWEQGGTLRALEPMIRLAAQSMATEWKAERASELDITVALALIQSSLHLCMHSCVPYVRAPRGSILVATAPGEIHLLGAQLACDVLAEAGFDARFLHPETEEAIEDCLAERSFSVVSLHLSPVFHRTERLAALGPLVRRLRRASRNKRIRVAIQGATFETEQPARH